MSGDCTGSGRPFMLRVMQEFMRSSIEIPPCPCYSAGNLSEPVNRQSEFLRARFEMAIAAGEIVAREACVPIGRVRSYVRIGHGQEVAPCRTSLPRASSGKALMSGRS